MSSPDQQKTALSHEGFFEFQVMLVILTAHEHGLGLLTEEELLGIPR